MRIIELLDRFNKDLEKEFIQDAIKIKIIWDSSDRMLYVGIDHPLWKSYLCDMRYLPQRGYDKIITELYNQFRRDLNIIDEHIRENYE